MSGQPYFLAIAGIAAGWAGFAGLLAVFRQGKAEWTPADLWRLKLIVRFSFVCGFLALLQIAVFAFLNTLRLTIQIASLAIALYTAIDIVLLSRHFQGVFPGDRSVLLFVAIDAAFGLLQLINVAWASLAIYELGLLQLLAPPASVFTRVLTLIWLDRSMTWGLSSYPKGRLT